MTTEHGMGDHTTKIAEFVRNPGGETIQVHVVGESVSVATWRDDGTLSNNEFTCAQAHLPKLIEALQAAHATRPERLN